MEGGGPRGGGPRCTPCARPVGHGAGLSLLGAGPAPRLSRAAAVRSGHARTLDRPRSRYGPARPLAWRRARIGSEPGGWVGTGVGSPKVPGWEANRGCGKGWASPWIPLLGLGMECGRVSVKGFVTGSLLPSPRLVFKRERRQRENVLLSRPHGLSCVAPGSSVGEGQQSWEGRWTFLSISRFVYMFHFLPDSTSPRPGRSCVRPDVGWRGSGVLIFWPLWSGGA